MYYIGSIQCDPDFLEHHGILGMKWGQRNGPPYPLTSSDHSAAEKKAGWRKSLTSHGAQRVKNTRQDSHDQKNDTTVEKRVPSAISTYREELEHAIKDLQEKGQKSSHIQKLYGQSWQLDDANFKEYFGQSKETAVKHELDSLVLRQEVAKKAEEDSRMGRFSDSQKILIGCACVIGVLAVGKYAYPVVKDRIMAGKNIVTADEFILKYWAQQTRSGMFNAISQEAFDNMDTSTMFLQKGSDVHRVSKTIGTVLHSDNVYASTLAEDAERYKAILPRLFWRGWNGELPKVGYVNNYKALSDLVSPSEKTRVQEFINLIADQNALNGKSGRELLDAFLDYRDPRKIELKKILQKGFAIFNKEDAFHYVRRGSTDDNLRYLFNPYRRNALSDQELARRAYNIFSTLELKHGSSPLTQAYINRLKAMGYNAIVDDNDRGRLAQLPFIVFNAANNLEFAGADRFVVQDMNRIGVLITDLLNRR